VTRPEDVKTVFKDSDTHSKAEDNNAGWLMGQLLGKCLGLITGPGWQQTRTCLVSTFTQRDAKMRIPRIEEHIREHFARLRVNVRSNEGIIDPVKDLRLLPFWIVAELLYGTLTPQMQDELAALIPIREALFARVIQGGVTRYAWSQYLPTETNRKLKEFNRRWKAFNETALEACELSSEKDRPVVQLYEALRKGHISLENVHQTLDEMLFANLDVTIGALSWNLIFLAAHPDTQLALRAEVKQARGCLQGTATWEEYLTSSSSLLAASILESGRLKPLAAFTVPQAAATDRIIGGYLIPAGTDFVVDTHALNIRNPFWGRDGHMYRPSRFLERKGSELRYQYWRYGFGPRQCLGKHFADAVIRAVLVHLMESYALSLHEESKWDRSPASWILHPDTVIKYERLPV
jgi:cytochrome P450